MMMTMMTTLLGSILFVRETLSSGNCDVTQCTVTVYQKCLSGDTPSSTCEADSILGQVGPTCLAHCGDGCEYRPDGIGDSECAHDPCPDVTGNGEWQMIATYKQCVLGRDDVDRSVIDAIEVTGGCSFQLARDISGLDPFDKIFEPGFHGLWNTFDEGYDYSDGN